MGTAAEKSLDGFFGGQKWRFVFSMGNSDSHGYPHGIPMGKNMVFTGVIGKSTFRNIFEKMVDFPASQV